MQLDVPTSAREPGDRLDTFSPGNAVGVGLAVLQPFQSFASPLGFFSPSHAGHACGSFL